MQISNQQLTENHPRCSLCQGDGKIDAEELNAVFTKLGHKTKRNDIVDMIWEVDENGCGSIDLAQFQRCYERAAADRSGFEPRKLATLVDFLLMDEENLGYVTEDQISELMTARYGTWLRRPLCLCLSVSISAPLPTLPSTRSKN